MIANPAKPWVKTYLDTPSMPQLRLPAGTCDSHVHIFGPIDRFPYADGLRNWPVEAPREKLFALHQRLGIDRCVIVQSVTHGFDNRVVEDAIEAGEGRYLGIALVPVTVSDEELIRLATRGFRGVRFHFMQHLAGGPSADEVVALTPRLAHAGLHLQVHFESALVHTVGAALKASAVPVVIDHMGRVDARLGPIHTDFQALQRLLDHENFYVKVSGIDRIEPAGPPYPSGEALARQLVEKFPEKVLWGLDWPHPNHTHIPDDGALVNALGRIAPSAELKYKFLVDNPQKLYRFAVAQTGRG